MNKNVLKTFIDFNKKYYINMFLKRITAVCDLCQFITKIEFLNSRTLLLYLQTVLT